MICFFVFFGRRSDGMFPRLHPCKLTGTPFRCAEVLICVRGRDLLWCKPAGTHLSLAMACVINGMVGVRMCSRCRCRCNGIHRRGSLNIWLTQHHYKRTSPHVCIYTICLSILGSSPVCLTTGKSTHHTLAPLRS